MILDPQINIGTCACCGYEDIEVKPYTSLREYEIHNSLPASTKLLCRACSHTPIGTLWGFPSQSAHGVITLAQSVAWLFNDLTHRQRKSSYSQSSCCVCGVFLSPGICVKEPCEGCELCGRRLCDKCWTEIKKKV